MSLSTDTNTAGEPIQLYAALLQRPRIHDRRIVWDSRMAYTHAPSAQQAKVRILAAEPMGVKCMMVAEAIGYIAEDEHGDKVRA